MNKELMDLLRDDPFPERMRKIRDGLRAPKGSGERKYAQYLILRTFGSYGFAIALSILVVLVASVFSVGTTRGGKDLDFEVTMVTPETVKFDELKIEDTKMAEFLPEVVEAVKPPEVDENTPIVPGELFSGAEFDSGETGSGAGEATGAGAGEGESAFDQLAPMMTKSPVVLKGVYGNRSPAGRGKALKQFSGGLGNETEFAVKKALKWLKKHQNADGSWGTYYPVAMTGLAVLTILAHGESTTSEEYGESLRRSLRYLLKIQKNGMFNSNSGQAYYNYYPEQSAVYEHAIATYAISEAYGITSIPFLKIAMEDAVQVIIDGQHEGGSWDYGYRKGPDANLDVSVAGWHLQALEAAVNAGAENRGLKTCIEGGMRGLKAMVDKSGSGMFRYSTRIEAPPNQTMAGVAVLCMQLTGHALDAEARAGINTLKDMPFKWAKGTVPNQDQRQVGDWPLYAWYYITQARFHQGAKTWDAWNKQFAPVLCSMQNPDGSWCPPPQSLEAPFGPIYATALSALMLEVYYRFLPTYQPIQYEDTKTPKEGKPAEEEEVVIKFG